MKYILWGAGASGNRAIDFLGKEKIETIIDSNRSGEYLQEFAIKSFEQCENIIKKHIIIITVFNKDIAEEISQYLEDKGIDNYLFFNEMPFCMGDATSEFGSSFDDFCFGSDNESWLINGINVFSLLLMEYLKKRNKNIYFYAQTSLKASVLDIIKEEFDILKNNTQFDYGVDVVGEEKFDDICIKCYDAEALLFEKYNKTKKSIMKFKDIHRGKRCFIVATGGSLTIEDLNKLHEAGEYTISMNRIIEAFDHTEYRPDYYVVADSLIAEQLADEIINMNGVERFCAYYFHEFYSNFGSGIVNDYVEISVKDKRNQLFSPDFSKVAIGGGTVTYTCLQLAVYLGFTNIFLLGVDFDYNGKEPELVTHFYGQGKRKIRVNKFDYELQLQSYKAAKRYADNNNCKIYNATRGGALEVFERVNFDELFKEG